MKKVFSILLVLSLLIMSCDKVLIPQQPHTVVIPTNDTIRKIFIEDFTGHTCPNCPPAAHKLDSLKAAFPQQVIGMAVHIDFFAIPCPPNPAPAGHLPGTFTEDFRTTENADYENIYTVSGWAYPNGLINRLPDPINASLPTGIDFWASSAATLLADSMTAYIKIHPTYSSGTLNVTVTGEFLCDTTGSYNIALYLVEDDLHGSQTDDDVPGGIINNYTFNDVFRGCINTPGTINGAPLTLPASISGHTPINYTSPSFTVNSNFNAANCKIIAVLINTADGGILQVAECDLQ
jgi:hypothetical protein